LPLLRQAASGVPAVAGIQYHLAWALAAAGDESEALEVLRRVLESRVQFDERADAERLFAKLQPRR